MEGKTRVNKEELQILITNRKANGEDASSLENLLAEVVAEENNQPPPRRQTRIAQPRMAVADEEATTAERLSVEVGYLFPEGLTEAILEEIIAYDRDHTLGEIKKECEEAGLSASGHKKKLAAKLIARRRT